MRLFALSVAVLRSLKEYNDKSRDSRGDLCNEHGRTVPSGVYVALAEIPELAASKVLKFAILH